jgi:hypothetical protein
MTGSREAFFELDGGVIGLVKFGDGSKVENRGWHHHLSVLEQGAPHTDGQG